MQSCWSEICEIRWPEMFLIFQLGRLDVWPVGDLGVRKGYATWWGLPEMPTPKELDAYGETFRPYRSVAAWYCWRAVDTPVRRARRTRRDGLTTGGEP